MGCEREGRSFSNGFVGLTFLNKDASTSWCRGWTLKPSSWTWLNLWSRHFRRSIYRYIMLNLSTVRLYVRRSRTNELQFHGLRIYFTSTCLHVFSSAVSDEKFIKSIKYEKRAWFWLSTIDKPSNESQISYLKALFLSWFHKKYPDCESWVGSKHEKFTFPPPVLWNCVIFLDRVQLVLEAISTKIGSLPACPWIFFSSFSDHISEDGWPGDIFGWLFLG